MNDKYSKAAAAFSLVAVLLVGFVVYRSYYPFAIPSDFSKTGETVTVDLMGKSIGLPQGQIWGFNPDQQLAVEVVSKKAMSDDMVLIVFDVKSIVKFPPPPKDEKKDVAANVSGKEPLIPKKATLSGLGKAYYEKHKEQWYLVILEGINLKVEAE